MTAPRDPQVDTGTDPRPDACPICGGYAFNVRVQGERMTVEVHFRDGWRA